MVKFQRSKFLLSKNSSVAVLKVLNVETLKAEIPRTTIPLFFFRERMLKSNGKPNSEKGIGNDNDKNVFKNLSFICFTFPQV
jgi:hypothetical protein